MKKTLMIVLKAVFGLIILWFAVNLTLYIYCCCVNKMPFNLKNAFYRENIHIEDVVKKYKYREPAGLDYSGKSIIIMGCGYGEGGGIADEDTFAYKLSNYVKKPVYNRAVGGGGVQHAIAQVRSGRLDDVIKNSSHVIYVHSAVWDYARLFVYPGPVFDAYFLPSTTIYPKYVLKDDKFVWNPSKLPFLEGSFINRVVEKVIYEKKMHKTEYNNLQVLNLYFETLNNELKKINPNVKLVVLLYYADENYEQKYTDVLKEKDITLLSVETFMGKFILDDKYREPLYKHPNGLAWEKIVKELSKILKL